MSERRKKVETYHVDMRCDFCGVGYMRTTGLVIATFPVRYEHKCNACGIKQEYTCTYPHIETKEVDDDKSTEGTVEENDC